MKIKTLLSGMLALAVIPAFAAASNATPKRLGPVTYYGALHTDGGKIIGSKNKEEAVLRGMSLFWSDGTGTPYYSKTVIGWAAENLPMDVFRYAMGIQYYNSDGQATEPIEVSDSYKGAPEGSKSLIDKMVEAAIENDIYIIIDWHSHRANDEQAIAKAFFEEMAAKYKDVPNVIYEIFNEPVHQSWSQVTSYANAVIPAIRKSTENLILVGTPSWSQMTEYGGLNYTNIGYVLHFYAGTHSVDQYGGRATAAKKSGNAVFITEWGTTEASGAGSPNSGSTNEGLSFMDNNNISNCNWSLRTVKSDYAKDKQETSAMFDGSENLNTVGKLNNATLSTSGKLVKPYLEKHKRNWGEMYVKAKNTGTCAFKSTTAKETDGQITGVLKSGCTYESSNPNVVAVDGGNMVIKSAGFSILTSADGSQSFVQITSIPGQSIPGFENQTCSFDASCTVGNRALAYSSTNATNKEWVITTETKTAEGSTFKLESLNPEIVKVKQAKCATSSCTNAQKNKDTYMYEFVGYGTAKVVATAPAVSGFRAMNDTILVTFRKAYNKMRNVYGNVEVAVGGTAEDALPDQTLYKVPVTYTYNGKETSPYITKSGTDLVAGSENAIIQVTAHAAEADNFYEMNSSIIVIVGDSSKAVNKDEFQQAMSVIKTNPKLPMQAVVNGNMLSVNSNESGEIHVDVFSVTGQKVLSKDFSKNFGALSLANIPYGSYLITIRQGAKQLDVKWNKK